MNLVSTTMTTGRGDLTIRKGYLDEEKLSRRLFLRSDRPVLCSSVQHFSGQRVINHCTVLKILYKVAESHSLSSMDIHFEGLSFETPYPETDLFR